jgi:hypothetical protein
VPAYSIRRVFWAGPVAALSAIISVVLYYGVTKAFGEQYLIPVTANDSLQNPIPPATIIVAILVSGLLATVFFGLLIQFSRKPATVFLSVAITALIVSFGGPFSLPTATMQTKILLGGMHVIAAIAITAGILLLSRKKKPKPGQ